MQDPRYRLITLGRRHILLSRTSAAIMEALTKHGELYYDDLTDLTGIPRDSLYVFAERLEKAKLMKRARLLTGKPRRVRTVLRVSARVRFVKLEVIR